jgi:cell division control protein 6
LSRRILEEELRRETVFRDAGKLLPDYVPPTLVHRNKEFRWLSQVFRPLVESRASQRVLITGSVGVGKTVLALKFGSEFGAAARERKVGLDYLHINCRKDKTVYSVYVKLLQYYNPRWPYHGLGPEKLLKDVVAHLNSHDKYLLLTLDEIDYFVQLNGPDILYSLTRVAEEVGGINRISLIAIAKDQAFLQRLDAATQSTFMHNVLVLSKYTARQLADIMGQRIEEAFKPGAVDPETTELIADIAARWGNARLALEILWRAGMVADREGSDAVLPEHAREAKAEVHPEIKKEILQELQLQEKLLLLALARRLKISKRAYAMTGEVEKSYRIVCEEYGERFRKHTQLWEYLKRLEGLGLVDLQPSGPGQRGTSTRASVPDVPVVWLEKELERVIKRK